MQDVKARTPDNGALEVCSRDVALGRIEGIDALARQFEEVGDLGYFIFDAVIEEFLYVSSGFGRIYGVDAKAYMENIKSLDDDLASIVSEDRKRVLESYQKHLCLGVNCVVEYRIRRTDGKIRWLRESSTALRIENGKVMLTIGAIQDVTSQLIFGNELVKAKQKLEKHLDEQAAELADTIKLLQHEIRKREQIATRLEFLSRHDALTELPMLQLCKERLDYAMIESRFSHQNSAVLFIGLDDFKVVNDTFGREIGDQLLKEIADRLKSETRETDTLARMSGDEFVMVLCAVGARQKIESMAAKLIGSLHEPLCYGDQHIKLSASIGIAVFPDDGNSANELISQADKAMYCVKRSGKNGFKFVDDRRQSSP